MKKQTTKTINHENNNINIHQNGAHQLSDNAFYLIALALELKKTVRPQQLNDYLVPGIFVGLNGKLSG